MSVAELYYFPKNIRNSPLTLIFGVLELLFAAPFISHENANILQNARINVNMITLNLRLLQPSMINSKNYN